LNDKLVNAVGGQKISDKEGCIEALNDGFTKFIRNVIDNLIKISNLEIEAERYLFKQPLLDQTVVLKLMSI
jgi:hypothetical protein